MITHLFRQRKPIFALLLLMISLVSFAFAESYETLWDSYQQTAERVEGQAYVEFIPFTSPVRPVHSADPNYSLLWQIGQFVKETNGVPFTVSKATFTRFGAEHNVLIDISYEGDELSMTGLNSTLLEPGVPSMFTTFHPVDETVYYGFRLDGVDANGNERSFCTLLPLESEPYAVETPDDYRTSSEGASLIELIPSENPVYTAEYAFFGGNTGWSFSVTVKNVADVPVELTGMSFIYFDSEDIRYQYRVDGQAIADWASVENTTIAPGESVVFSDMSPLQALTGVGYRFTAKDESGSTQTANLFIELNKDMKAQ